ncbi:MAG: Bax inhibitor-1/YccA family protein [Muribaculaceae bacterium]|nr:Bax inhibitor-1/YccA family protein [Muribaculaceae bacterium]
MKRVYLKMFLGLLVTAFLSMFCASSASYMHFMVYNSWFYWGLFIAEIVLVIVLSSRITKMSSATATLLFYAFAAVNGLALAPIFLVYTATSIAKTFFICAGTFGAMSIYGYFTTQDLTKWGNFLFYALIGLIIASVVNIFTKSSQLDWIISIAGVLIFVGLTAWDTQKIKQMAQYTPAQYAGHLATIGALSLYLDFINLFLYLLRFFGNQRD